MKAFLVISTLMLSLQAGAVAVDNFHCEVTLKDLKTQSEARQTQDFSVARLPLSRSPAPDVRLTAGESQNSMRLVVGNLSLNLSTFFHYEHAVKLENSGHEMDARQSTCLSIGAGYCTEGECRSEMASCSVFSNPYDPVSGWDSVPMLSGLDMPAFKSDHLAPISANIKDEQGHEIAVVGMTCRYVGSYQ